MKSARGFTLIELLIAVVIVSILTVIAFPSYRSYVLRTNRVAAKAAMTEVVSRQESYYADHKRYADSLTKLGYVATTIFLSSDGAPSATENQNTIYSLTLTSTSNTGYTVAAVPKRTQAQDSQCGSLYLTGSGIKTASGSSTSRCWKN